MEGLLSIIPFTPISSCRFQNKFFPQIFSEGLSNNKMSWKQYHVQKLQNCLEREFSALIFYTKDWSDNVTVFAALVAHITRKICHFLPSHRLIIHENSFSYLLIVCPWVMGSPLWFYSNFRSVGLASSLILQ